MINNKENLLWQPRICCWFDDRDYKKTPYPAPYTGMTHIQVYEELGCSDRLYMYNECIESKFDETIKYSSNKIDTYLIESIIETPVGKVTAINKWNTDNPGTFPSKWWVETEEDLKVYTYIEEHTEYFFNQETYDKLFGHYSNLGLPVILLPRVTIQRLFIDLMGVENTIYALADYPETVEMYFEALNKSQEKLIKLVATTPFEWVNYGDNIHCGILTSSLFKKYVLPAYKSRNEILRKAGKFTFAHWDGDVKQLLPFAKETGLSGIEAITPVPQGDVTLKEVKEALGDEVFLVDGIAALLFNNTYSEEMLIEQTKEVIELFAPKLILGISDEIPSDADLERVKIVSRIVNEYNEKITSSKT